MTTIEKPNKKITWLIYTLLIGTIPFLCRLLVSSVSDNASVEVITSSDVIQFGLLLHISSINEIEHIETGGSWKTIQNGMAIVFIIAYSILFATTIAPFKGIDVNSVKNTAMCLAGVSICLSYSVFHRASNIATRVVNA